MKPGYLAFLGRISPEKGVDRRSGSPARARHEAEDRRQGRQGRREYFEDEIEPLLDAAHVEFIGEIDDAQKPAFLSARMALLFPIDWPEPFGLVMIESDGLRHAGDRRSAAARCRR